MNGVPADLDLTFLVGQELTTISISQWSLQFMFQHAQRLQHSDQPAGHIVVWGSWRLCSALGTVIDESVGPVRDSPLGNQSQHGWEVRSLLEDAVESAELDVPDSFTLRFTSGNRLTIYDDYVHLHSFSVNGRDV